MLFAWRFNTTGSASDGKHVNGTAEQGKVTLSWPSLLRDLAEPHDGDNVGYHEFAHALDGADGSMDGEALGPPGPFRTVWRYVIERSRAEMVRAVGSGLTPPIRAYAATSDAEVFAVATEWFFERPRDLRGAMPAVYDLLRDFYRQDPAARP